MRPLRRKDGTDDFRPLTGATALRQMDLNLAAQSPRRDGQSPGHRASLGESPSAKWLKGAGLPGFGDNEKQGKVLPCERVSEDGLMRIDCSTVSAPSQSFLP